MRKGHRGTRAVWLLAAAALAGVACGGESSGGSAPTGSCQTVCDKIASLACSADDPSTCVGDCELSFATVQQQCPSQLSVYLGCLQTRVTITCGPDGMATADSTTIRNACWSSVSALTACTACNPDPADTACETCRKTSCCSEWRALSTHPDAREFLNCVDACPPTTTDCTGSCLSQFPSYQQAAERVAQCQIANCPAC